MLSTVPNTTGRASLAAITTLTHIHVTSLSESEPAHADATHLIERHTHGPHVGLLVEFHVRRVSAGHHAKATRVRNKSDLFATTATTTGQLLWQ